MHSPRPVVSERGVVKVGIEITYLNPAVRLSRVLVDTSLDMESDIADTSGTQYKIVVDEVQSHTV
jgi:hypothetical protein